ncbi:MAG: ABC-type transport auxiliary lipoprotein family protein [Candidatus Acidiferrum sp.]
MRTRTRLPKNDVASNFMAVRCSREHAAVGVLLAISLLSIGCGSPRPIKYYQLSYPMKPFVAPDAINTTLVVSPFETSRLYLDNRIVYGFDSPEMGTYQYHRWVDPPAEIVQDALIRGLRSTGQFKAVYPVRANSGGPFLLTGTLYDFKEVDGASVVARLSYDIHMRERKTGATVWDQSYSHDEPVPEKTVTAFVVAMQKNVQRSVQDVQAGLEEYFRAHPLQ